MYPLVWECLYGCGQMFSFKMEQFRNGLLIDILLATKATLIQGDHRISWDTFCAAIGSMDYNTVPWGRPLHHTAVPISHFTSLQWLGNPPPMENSADKLLFYLLRTRSRKSKFPHDKVFSVLGRLSSADILALSTYFENPDYEPPISDLYEKVARQLIRVSGSLDILSAYGLPDEAGAEYKRRLPYL